MQRRRRSFRNPRGPSSINEAWIDYAKTAELVFYLPYINGFHFTESICLIFVDGQDKPITVRLKTGQEALAIWEKWIESKIVDNDENEFPEDIT